MAKKTVIAELQEILKLTPKAKETQNAFAERVARKANDMHNDDWEGLAQDTQLWVNAALAAIEAKKAVPLPTGIDAVVPAAEDATDEDEAEEAPAKPAKRPGRAVPAKAAPKGKPAQKGSKKAPEPRTHAGRAGRFNPEAKIKVLTEGNPYRKGSKSDGWFEQYKNDFTVKQAVEAGTPLRHLRWAVDNDYLKIG
jgi:hypothetical protein